MILQHEQKEKENLKMEKNSGILDYKKYIKSFF